MKVSRLPVDTGVSGWDAILPRRGPVVSLSAGIKADIVVIGAGFAGLSACRRLTQLRPDLRIVLLDAKRVAEGPAGRNSGFMIDLPHDLSATDYTMDGDKTERQIALNRQAIAFAAEAAREYDMPREAYDPCGKVNAAACEASTELNLSYARQLDELGESYDMLDAEAMHRLTGSRFYHSGLFTPGTAMLQPAMYIRSLATGLGNRVSVFENSPVTSLDRLGNNWVAQTSSGSVEAPKVLLTTNGHVESFGFFERRLMHVILFASMTRALTEPEQNKLAGKETWGITPSNSRATSLRKISGMGGTRVLTRNRMVYEPGMSVSQATVDKMGRDHDKAFALRWPDLAGLEQEYRWAGRLCLSYNGVAAFGELEPGLFSACCQNGLGTARGTLMGMAVAELMYEGKTELACHFLDEAEPQKLPPFPLAEVGAKVALRWGEYKARREM